MQSVIVEDKNENTKIERYIQSHYPGLSYSTLQKAFRQRDIKVNGKRVGREHIVMPGDKLEIYITDELLSGAGNASKSVHPDSDSDFGFSIVYEDENIIIVNKAQGVPVHPDKEQSGNTLIDMVRDYLLQKGGNPSGSADFQPSLCHRLDRNTGGLVIIAKNRISHDIILDKLESREIKKLYQCLVKGRMEKRETRLRAYLWKDADKSRVYINNRRTAGSMEIITGYKVLEYYPVSDVSRLEVELVTGRTHQIRAHLAFVGHPLIGDGKYGVNTVNRSFGIKQQALWACSIKFEVSDRNALDYLNGKEFSIEPEFNIKSLR